MMSIKKFKEKKWMRENYQKIEECEARYDNFYIDQTLQEMTRRNKGY